MLFYPNYLVGRPCPHSFKVGYGDITATTDAERAYSIAAMVVGGGFYGYVVGSITTAA